MVINDFGPGGLPATGLNGFFAGSFRSAMSASEIWLRMS